MASGMVAEKNTVCRCCRQFGDHAPQVGQEAHVEHAVGFVQHEDFDGAQVDEALVHQIEQPARRGDQDIDAVPQVADLRLLPTPPKTTVCRSAVWRP